MRLGIAAGPAGLLLALALGVAAAGCAAGPSPKVGWENPGEPAAELERDREACVRYAMDGEFPHPGRDRAEAAFRGNLFLQCMSERGWRQVLVDE